LRSYDVLDEVFPHSESKRTAKNGHTTLDQDARNAATGKFREAAEEVCEPSPEREHRKAEERETLEASSHKHHRVRDPANAVADLGLGALGAIANIGEKLFDGFFGGAPPKPRQPANDQPKPRAEHDVERAHSAERQSHAEDTLAEEAARLETFWQRRRSRGRRDRD
jgi:hypothetical protein